jgi:hypothetical protein
MQIDDYLGRNGYTSRVTKIIFSELCLEKAFGEKIPQNQLLAAF